MHELDKPFFAEDGLMSTEPNEFLPGYGSSPLTTCNNDNGILFLAYYSYLTYDFYNEEGKQLLYHLFSLAKMETESKWPGLFHRNPGRSTYINSHDNYVGYACLAILHGDTTILQDTVKHWPVLNNVNPGHLHAEKGQPSGIHSPADWFLYTLSIGKSPSWFRTIAFVTHILITIYGSKPGMRWSSRLLTWLRCKAFMRSQKRPWYLKNKLATWACNKYFSWLAKTMPMELYFNYFKSYHPNWIHSRGLTF